MDEQQGTGQEPPAGQEPTTEQQQGGTPPPQGQEPTPPQGQESGEGTDPRLAEVRREAASYRTKVRELEQQVEQLQQAQMSEQERIVAERDTLRAERDRLDNELAHMRKASAITQAAVAARVVDPELAVALLADGVSLDDDGKPVGVAEAVAQLVEAKPYLVASGTVTVPGSPAGQPPSPNRAENGKRVYRRSELADRTFYVEHRDDILAALREGRIQED